MTPAGTRAMLAALPSALQSRIDAGLDEAAAVVAAEARSRLAGAGPSAAGGSPADRSGALARSIATGRDPETGAAVVTVDAPYAAALEYGTARMAARPYLRPAAAAAEPEIRDRLASTMTETCRAALDDAS